MRVNSTLERTVWACAREQYARASRFDSVRVYGKKTYLPSLGETKMIENVDRRTDGRKTDEKQ